MRPPTHTVGGYRASFDNDVLTVHRVPIFCACVKKAKTGDVFQFDDAWIKTAVANAMQQQRDSYHPPLHIRHHADGGSVTAAGFFTIVGAAPITFKGTRRTAIMADLVITDPAIQAEVLAGRLPYRSVEIFNVDEPAIDSLALLDHEAPFLELPMLMVAAGDQPQQRSERSGLVVREGDDAGGVVADATFGMHYEHGPAKSVVGSFRKGQHAFQLFRDENAMNTATATGDLILNSPKTMTTFGEGIVPVHLSTPADVKFESDDDKPKDKDKDEDMEGDTALDVSAVVKAIESGSISIADMDQILAAIQAQGTAAEPEEEPQAAPAAVPGAEAMKKEPDSNSVEMAALQGEVAALRAKDTARDTTDERVSDIATALQRLDGRPLGADLEGKLTKYHTDHGPLAFKAYVDSMAETFGVLPGTTGADSRFQNTTVPEVAMAYQSQGTDAVAKAAQFAADWDELRSHGMASKQPQARYIELSMARDARQEN